MSFVDVLERFFEVDLSTFADTTVYFIMAASSSLLFMLRLGMALFLGMGDDGGDFGDADDFDHGDSTGAFKLFSILSIMAFFMGTGWMGLACRTDFEMGQLSSAITASAFGLAMMLLASGLMAYIKRLSQAARYDAGTAVGRTGRVYLTIPARGQGRGQVEVEVSGRRKVMNAVSTADEIAAFTTVKVVEVGDDDTLTVQVEA